ncbi:serine/threonine-protein kinase [Roseomonas harenae]|uniref:serine/threonine-protein kinase n=1 Tax=Muricoccus harenae TaxID=2692566 RepID=UPI0013319B15|nr:serine/threonine-protein kinase [Roseomonas harenae]
MSPLLAGAQRLATELPGETLIDFWPPANGPVMMPSAQARSAAVALAQAVAQVTELRNLRAQREASGAAPGPMHAAAQDAAIEERKQGALQALREVLSILGMSRADDGAKRDPDTTRMALPSAESSFPGVSADVTLWSADVGATLPAHAAGPVRLLDGNLDLDGEPIIVADRYEARDLIGRGAFGTVIEAYDRRLARLVAVKVVRVATIPDDVETEMLERFRQEARTVARLSHPGIVPVHDFGEGAGYAWIAMELVIGESLKAALDAGHRFSPAEAARISIELLEALDFAHSRGVVHRDVKPANILLVADQRAGHGPVRLVDFGVSRLGDTGLTTAGQMIGTLTTMSPEQVRGEVVDARADLWGAGVVLYQLLTGHRPFEGNASAVIAGILARDPVPPTTHAPHLPPGFDAVTAAALAKPVDQRFASAREFIQALAPLASEVAGVEGGAEDRPG